MWPTCTSGAIYAGAVGTTMILPTIDTLSTTFGAVHGKKRLHPEFCWMYACACNVCHTSDLCAGTEQCAEPPAARAAGGLSAKAAWHRRSPAGHPAGTGRGPPDPQKLPGMHAQAQRKRSEPKAASLPASKPVTFWQHIAHSTAVPACVLDVSRSGVGEGRQGRDRKPLHPYAHYQGLRCRTRPPCDRAAAIGISNGQPNRGR